MLNEIPVEYFSQLDHNGVRLDLEQRPELCGGSVEYLAPQEYMVCAPLLSSLLSQFGQDQHMINVLEPWDVVL